MEQLSRRQLYEWILNSGNNGFGFIEDERIRVSLFENGGIFLNTVRFNLEMLRDIESYYASSMSDEIKVSFTSENFKNIYQENLIRGFENLNAIIPPRYFETEREVYSKFVDEISDTVDLYYMFNKLMKQLDKTSNRSLRLLYKDIEANGKGESLYFEHRSPQVFLSYASEDRLYTLCIYIYIYEFSRNKFIC